MSQHPLDACVQPACGDDLRTSGNSWRRTLVAILLLAFLVRIAFSLGICRGLLHIQPELESTDGYHLIAQSLYDGHGYRFSTDKPLTLQRAPAYPAFLLAIFSIVGINYVWVQIAQAALGALGCWLLFKFGRWVLSIELGLMAAFLYALYPNSILYSARLYAENLYFPAFFAFAYLLCRASFEGSMRHGFGAGIAWGAGLLTRGTLLPFPLVLPIGIALSRWHRSPASRWLRWTLPALLAGILVVAPWTMRNHALTDHFVPVSSWAWGPMYQGMQVAKKANQWQDLSSLDMEAGRHIRELAAQEFGRADGTVIAIPSDEIRYDAIARDLTLTEWADDPVAVILRAIRGFFYTWFFAFGPSLRMVSLAVHTPLLLLFVAGTIQMVRRHPEAFTRSWPALGLILFVNLFYALAYPHVRYMAPAIALSFIFSALPLLTVAARWRMVPRSLNGHKITAVQTPTDQT